MSTIVYRISVLLSAILAEVPVGTNLGLFWLLWALISGRFLLLGFYQFTRPLAAVTH